VLPNAFLVDTGINDPSTLTSAGISASVGGIPTGTVTIKIKSTVLCTIRLANGTGSCTLSARRLNPGSYSLTASYGGSTYYTGTCHQDPEGDRVGVPHR
jgi:hypothetical protein